MHRYKQSMQQQPPHPSVHFVQQRRQLVGKHILVRRQLAAQQAALHLQHQDPAGLAAFVSQAPCFTGWEQKRAQYLGEKERGVWRC